MGMERSVGEKSVEKKRKRSKLPSHMERLIVLHRVVTKQESFVEVAFDQGKHLGNVMKMVMSGKAKEAKESFRHSLEAERKLRAEFEGGAIVGVGGGTPKEAESGKEVKALPAAREETEEEEVARIVARRAKEMES
jgi:hypothetical protein